MRAPRPATLAGLCSLGLMLTALAMGVPVMERLELALLDWRFLVRGPQAPATPVSIVAVDAASVDEYGRWPWRRSRIAELIDRVSDAGAQVIGLDMVFSEPEETPESAPLLAARNALAARNTDPDVITELDRALLEADTDERLAQALEESDRVVLGYFFRTERAERGRGPSPEALHAVRRSKVSSGGFVPPDTEAPVLRCSDVEANLGKLHATARRSGFFTANRAVDGAIRAAPLILRCAGDFYVSLPLAMVELMAGTRATLFGDAKTLTTLRLGETLVPIDERGQILVNYLGPRGSVPHVPAADVLAGRIPENLFQGHAVVIGVTEVGLADLQTTPFDNAYPGIEVHATVLDNLLSGRTLVRRDDLVGIEVMLVIGLAMLVTFAVPRFSSVMRGAVFTTALGLGIFGAATWVFVAQGVWLNIAYPTATLLLTYLLVTVATSAVQQLRGRMLRRAFATYVPPAVVDQIVQQPERLSLGGERRDLSILFSDVRDFTTLSERLGPEDTARLMNTYLTEMTRIVFDSGGTLDKYIGDAVVTFWGAPLPVEQHPKRAALAALEMQRETARLRESDLPGAEALQVGIGVHAGEVVVGNLGSELRFDYTITGDGVNLCSRLEGLTKSYGVEILASQSFVDDVHEVCGSREIDRVRVKGRKEPVAIFELVDAEAMAAAAPWHEAYAEALVHHRAARFERAAEAFDRADRLRPGGDPPARVMRERAQGLAESGLSEWDGVHDFETK